MMHTNYSKFALEALPLVDSKVYPLDKTLPLSGIKKVYPVDKGPENREK